MILFFIPEEKGSTNVGASLGDPDLGLCFFPLLLFGVTNKADDLMGEDCDASRLRVITGVRSWPQASKSSDVVRSNLILSLGE